MTAVVIAQLAVLGFAFFMLLNSAAILVYMERKVAAFVQQRYGPYLVGPRGMLQPIADIVKLIFKEELRPKSADTLLFYVAPVFSATASFSANPVTDMFSVPTSMSTKSTSAPFNRSSDTSSTMTATSPRSNTKSSGLR